MSKAAILKKMRGGAPAGGAGGSAAIPTEPPDLGPGVIQRTAWLRRAGTLVLFAFVALGATSVFGVRDGDVTAEAGGYKLTVHYAEMTRPGLDTPWSARIERDGGFDAPVALRTTASFFELFDENGISPEPDAVRQDGKYLVMEFAKPEADELVVSFDARTSPAVQSGAKATTAVLEDGVPVVEVGYRTRVMP